MRKILSVSLVIVFAFTLVACNADAEDPNMNDPESSFRLLVSDQPADIADFAYLNIPILHTRIFVEEDGEESFIEEDIDVTVDLTQLVGSASIEVLELDLEPGDYTKIELYVDQPNIDAATVDDSAADIFVPSGKLMIENDFTIVEGEQVTFVFDINIIKKGQGTEYNLIPVISESGVVGEDLDESEVDEVTFESELTTEDLPVYAEGAEIPEGVTRYITEASLSDEEDDEVLVMSLVDETWVEEGIDLGEPEDVANDDLEEGEPYTWITLSEDQTIGTLHEIRWSKVDSNEE